MLNPYFESFDHLDLPFSIKDLRLSKNEQVTLATGEPGFVAALLRRGTGARATVALRGDDEAFRDFYRHIRTNCCGLSPGWLCGLG